MGGFLIYLPSARCQPNSLDLLSVHTYAGVCAKTPPDLATFLRDTQTGEHQISIERFARGALYTPAAGSIVLWLSVIRAGSHIALADVIPALLSRPSLSKLDRVESNRSDAARDSTTFRFLIAVAPPTALQLTELSPPINLREL